MGDSTLSTYVRTSEQVVVMTYYQTLPIRKQNGGGFGRCECLADSNISVLECSVYIIWRLASSVELRFLAHNTYSTVRGYRMGRNRALPLPRREMESL